MTFPYKLFQLHSYCVNIAKQRQSACLILGATYSSAIGRFRILVGMLLSVTNGEGYPRLPPAHFMHAMSGSLAEPQPDSVILVFAGSFPPTSDELSVLVQLFADEMHLSQHKCYNWIACKPDVAWGLQVDHPSSMKKENVSCQKWKCLSLAAKAEIHFCWECPCKNISQFFSERTVRMCHK